MLGCLPVVERDPSDALVADGRYRIEKLLGEGQMARVYLAEQTSMRRKVALKILHDSLCSHPSAPARFRREVEAVTRLKSPHTIVFHDFGQTEQGSLFIAMELLSGETLRARLKRESALPWDVVLGVVTQIARCLDEAHGMRVLHRDLKPENVFLCPARGDDDDPFVKVLDFGLAKLTDPPGDSQDGFVTSASVTVGTPAYLAPEMAMIGRTVDGRADLYSLAVMAFEMLVGRRPFNAESSYEMVRAHLRAPVPHPSQLRPGLPAGCDALFAVALAKPPEERFPTATAFATTLSNVLRGG
jgi:serine/threonine-protein kinase